MRHPHTTYEDSRGYWKKVRYLARKVVQGEATSCEDSYALFGNMNLDPNQSGSARDVRIDPTFGEWVLSTIRDKLRPMVLICLGLRTKREANVLLSRTFDEFELQRPHAVYPLRCVRQGSFTFREWDCVGPLGNQIKVVHWPQHPSRPPFGDLENWFGACQEFVNRHSNLIKP